MSEEQRYFLSLIPNIPARLTVEQTAWILNFQPHDIPFLVAERDLKPLGNPPPNGIKYFAACEILLLREDKAWLSRATNHIHAVWRRKNQSKGTLQIS